MGKTSLAKFIADFANKNYSMITAHMMDDEVHTIEDLIIQIIERILNSIKSEKWSEKIFGFRRPYRISWSRWDEHKIQTIRK